VSESTATAARRTLEQEISSLEKRSIPFGLCDALREGMETTTDVLDRPLLLRVPAAAELLGVSRSTMYELIAAGAIQTVHIGRACRVPRAEVEQYVEQLRRG